MLSGPAEKEIRSGDVAVHVAEGITGQYDTKIPLVYKTIVWRICNIYGSDFVSLSSPGPRVLISTCTGAGT